MLEIKKFLKNLVKSFYLRFFSFNGTCVEILIYVNLAFDYDCVMFNWNFMNGSGEINIWRSPHSSHRRVSLWIHQFGEFSAKSCSLLNFFQQSSPPQVFLVEYMTSFWHNIPGGHQITFSSWISIRRIVLKCSQIRGKMWKKFMDFPKICRTIYDDYFFLSMDSFNKKKL